MFVTRLASGVVLVLIALVTMIYGGIPLILVLAAIALIAYKELTKALLCATEGKKVNALEVIGLLGVAAYYALVYFNGTERLLLFCIAGVFLAMLFAYVIGFPRFQASQVVAAFFSFIYAPVMLAFVYMTREISNGNYVVWLILLSSWGCDTCAYCVGVLIGKKKIFPVLSPHKSLEGCIGGVLGAALLGGLYGYFFMEKAIPNQNVAWMAAIICAVGAVMSMVGDLAASAIKRNHDIKDYGHIIPGHGGMMDRFDSMIVTAPMIYIMATLLIQF